MKIIEGGVCAAKGFKAGSVRCGVKEVEPMMIPRSFSANANAPRLPLTR